MRFLLILPLAAGLSLALLWVMQSLLISSSDQPLQAERHARLVDFVRLRQTPEQETIRRRLPEPPPQRQKPPLPRPPQIVAAAPQMERAVVKTPQIKVPLDIGKGLSLGAVAPSDSGLKQSEAIPLVRVKPDYPRRALREGITGWVKVAFTISETGTVLDPEVVEAEPPRIFNRSALRAIRQWRFKPKLEQGKAVKRFDVVQTLDFTL